MKRNMNNWIEKRLTSNKRAGMPILSFPSTELLDLSVADVLSTSILQAKAMKAVADRTPNSAGAVSFMDLSVEAECFGSEIKFSDDEVPVITGHIINDEDEAKALRIPEVGEKRTGIYIEAIRLATKLITDRPIFAGVIGPYSLAGRLFDVSEVMILCYEEPEMVHIVLEKTSEFLKNYCLAYKEAGANGVIMAEPLAGLLPPALCEEFSSKYVKEIVDAVQDEEFIVIYHNCGPAVIDSIENIVATGARGFHFGNAIEMEKALEKCPSDVLVMGNIDPVSQFKNGTPEGMIQAVKDQLEKCASYNNYVISSGCDIPPKSSWANVDAFFEGIAEFYHTDK